MKKFCKHEKVAFLLSATAILLMAISLCPGGLAEATGILQGLSTGLLSGMVLLLITGIKGREIRELSIAYDFYSKSSYAFMAIIESYSTLYHKTYHGKKEKMLFSTYAGLIDEAYKKCYLAYQELDSLDRAFGQKDCIAEEIVKFIDDLKDELFNIQHKIYDARVYGTDKMLFNEIREMFYNLQTKPLDLYPKSSYKMRQIHEIREHAESAFL